MLPPRIVCSSCQFNFCKKNRVICVDVGGRSYKKTFETHLKCEIDISSFLIYGEYFWSMQLL
jgi:hypothetical protein